VVGRAEVELNPASPRVESGHQLRVYSPTAGGAEAAQAPTKVAWNGDTLKVGMVAIRSPTFAVDRADGIFFHFMGLEALLDE
jgi:hypothetical protein